MVVSIMTDSSYPHDALGNFESFTGEVVSIYIQQALSRYPMLAKNSEFKSFAMAAVDNMVMQIVSWCASGRIPSRSENFRFEYPDGTWQTFKHFHMPHWFTQRFPVRMKLVEVEKTTHHYFVCPHADVPWDRDKNVHIKFMATGTPLAERLRTYDR
jgi:hypothetical protein